MSPLWVLAVTVVILQASNLCTTIYLHRSLAHRGVELHPTVAFLMHLHLLIFTGTVPREWVAVHRKHHHHSDEEGDPHSPHLLGLWRVLFGNYSLYLRETRNPSTLQQYTRDYRPDAIDRIPALLLRILNTAGGYLGIVVFVAFFGWLWGTAAWAFHVVAYILLNASINSVCHMIGYRNYDNLATNVRSIALLTAGEGLHNNHHAFPRSARFSMAPGELDPAWPLIRLLRAVGLARVRSIAAERPTA